MKTKLMIALIGAFILSACGVRVTPDESQSFQYWNLSKNLGKSVDGKYKDNVVFKTVLYGENGSVELSNEVLLVQSNYAQLKIIFPANVEKPSGSNFALVIKKRGSFGKDAVYYLRRDNTPPKVSIVGISPEIQRGGSAVAVFKATDEKLDEVYVYNDSGYQFHCQKYITNDYYLTLFGSFVGSEDSKFYVVASDEAGNDFTNQLVMEVEPRSIRTTTITLSPPDEKEEETTETNVVTEQESTNQEPALEPEPPKKKLTIWEITTTAPVGTVKNFNILEFLPFPDWIQTSEFGKYRTYYLNGEMVTAYHHLGIDMMHYVNNPIRASNPGKVVYADYNGGYGNTIVIHHGMGLYSLHAHCSQLNYKVGDQVYATNIVALTGRTGSATGDHLHFSILIQGMYVDPAEWMDMDWIQENILSVIENSRNKIMSAVKKSS